MTHSDNATQNYAVSNEEYCIIIPKGYIIHMCAGVHL